MPCWQVLNSQEVPRKTSRGYSIYKISTINPLKKITKPDHVDGLLLYLLALTVRLINRLFQHRNYPSARITTMSSPHAWDVVKPKTTKRDHRNETNKTTKTTLKNETTETSATTEATETAFSACLLAFVKLNFLKQKLIKQHDIITHQGYLPIQGSL